MGTARAQLSNQRQIIVAGFGFTPLQTTLIGCVDGAVESAFPPPPLPAAPPLITRPFSPRMHMHIVIVITCTTTSASYWKNGRAYSGVLAYCVAILGAILVSTLSLSNRVGLLFSYWIASACSLFLCLCP